MLYRFNSRNYYTTGRRRLRQSYVSTWHVPRTHTSLAIDHSLCCAASPEQPVSPLITPRGVPTVPEDAPVLLRRRIRPTVAFRAADIYTYLLTFSALVCLCYIYTPYTAHSTEIGALCGGGTKQMCTQTIDIMHSFW